MFKKLFYKIKNYFSHERCYKTMESYGIAAFSMCKGVTGGDRFIGYLNYSCVDCPYLELSDRSNNND